MCVCGSGGGGGVVALTVDDNFFFSNFNGLQLLIRNLVQDFK